MTCLIACASLSGSHKEDELLPSGQSFHHRRHARIRTQSSQRLRGHGGAVPLHEEKVGNLNLLKMGEAHSVSSNLSHFYPETPRQRHVESSPMTLCKLFTQNRAARL